MKGSRNLAGAPQLHYVEQINKTNIIPKYERRSTDKYTVNFYSWVSRLRTATQQDAANS